MSEELKACPRCGGKTSTRLMLYPPPSHGIQNYLGIVTCENYDFYVEFRGDSPKVAEEAKEWWNLRTPDWRALAQKLVTTMVWRDSGKGPHESMSEFWAVWDAAIAEAKAAGLEV